MTAGRVVLLVCGIIVVLISLLVLVVGGGLVFVDRAITTSGGFFMTKNIRIQQDSHAIVTEPARLELGEADRWSRAMLGDDLSNLVKIRIRATNTDPEKGVFIGIGPSSKIESYLQNVAYDEITDMHFQHPRLVYTKHQGENPPAPPTEQPFWTASAHGKGIQLLTWGIAPGTYTVVVMNEDGSAGIDVNAAAGARVPSVYGFAVGALVLGFVILAVGILMIYLAVRRPRTSPPMPEHARAA